MLRSGPFTGVARRGGLVGQPFTAGRRTPRIPHLCPSAPQPVSTGIGLEGSSLGRTADAVPRVQRRGRVVPFGGAVCAWAGGMGGPGAPGPRQAGALGGIPGTSQAMQPSAPVRTAGRSVRTRNGEDCGPDAAGNADDRELAPSIGTGDCPQYVGSNARRGHPPLRRWR